MLHGAPSRTLDRPLSLAKPLKVRKLITGEVLMREGDDADAIYVILTGSLRVYRRDLTTLRKDVELATVAVGGVIGELGPILRRRRSATVQAIESSQVLEIPASELPKLAQQHQPILRIITSALRDRTDLSDETIEQMVSRVGLNVLAEPAQDLPTLTLPSAEGSPGLPVPAHDSTLVYPKSVECPSCGTLFSALTVHPRKDQPAERETDFHNIYRSAHNPYDFELWVCPNDLYAALPADFAELNEAHQMQVAPTVEQVVADWDGNVPEFNVDRTFELRQKGLELALALYTMRAQSHVRLAAITHRLAWTARERGDVDTERTWLARALGHYSTAYSEADLGGAKEELRIQYLCGELSLRLADYDGAVAWFAQASRHPALKEHAS
ncbi:MAG TPA: DUF2225 domain-containing protein, partial [Chloroflexota bacterium]|nr:DUF2225 domain-containing protein [Chloroflexota bacterium]